MKKSLKNIWQTTTVWRNCKVEGNYSESSNSIRKKKIEAWKGENSKFSKEKHFLPRLVAKANLASGTTQACDLWPVACKIPILLIFFQDEQKHFSAMPTLDNRDVFSCLKLTPN